MATVRFLPPSPLRTNTLYRRAGGRGRAGPPPRGFGGGRYTLSPPPSPIPPPAHEHRPLTRTVLLQQRKSTRSTAGQRKMPEGTTADPQELINTLVGVVAMDAFVTGSVATSMRKHGLGILDHRKHEGAVRKQMEKLRPTMGALKAAAKDGDPDAPSVVDEAVAAANLPPALAAAQPRPTGAAASKKDAPPWAKLPGPERGGQRYIVRAPPMPAHHDPA